MASPVRRSLRCGLVALASAVALMTAAPSAGQHGPVSLLERLGSALQGQPAWTASYHQEFLPAGMTVGEEVDGVVWAAWPDRAHFRSGEPASRLMGLDQRRVRLLDLDVPSCEEHLVSEDEWARIPLAAVLDPRSAVESFTVLGLGDRGFALEPREPGGVSRVEVELGDDDLPRSVLVVDPQGATNRLDFARWRPAGAPPDGSWLPAPPPGLTCSGDGVAGVPPGVGDDRGRLRR